MLNLSFTYQKKKIFSVALLIFTALLPIETYGVVSFELTKSFKVLLMLMMITLISMVNFREKIKVDTFSKFIVFFQILTLCMIPFSNNQEGSMVKWTQYFVIGLFYICLIQSEDIRENLKNGFSKLIPTLLFLSVLIMIIQLKLDLLWSASIFETATGTKRAVAFFNNANGLGGFLVTSTLYTVWLSIIDKKKVHIIISMVGIYGIYLSESEGSIIAFLIGILIILGTKFREIMAILRYVTTGMSLILFILFTFSETVQAYFINELKSQARYNLWNAAVKIFQDNWIFGIGNYNFSNVVKQYGVISKYGSTYPHPHNFILDFLVCYGIVGLIISIVVVSFIALLYFGKLNIIQNQKYYLITALLVQGFIHDLVDGGFLIGTSSAAVFQIMILSVYSLDKKGSTK